MNHLKSEEKRAQLLKALEDKHQLTGQETNAYLEGLLYADYLSYWDYIHLDTLLSLQNPKTAFADETIFITYHQVTELYFKMILSEMRQIGEATALTEAFFLARIQRINRYLQILIQSFNPYQFWGELFCIFWVWTLHIYLFSHIYPRF